MEVDLNTTARREPRAPRLRRWLRDNLTPTGAKEQWEDRAMRARIRPHEVSLDRYRVIVARQTQDYEDAFRLLHVAYAYQGIEDVRASKMRITAQHVLPEATVFVAYEGERCVGTMTVTCDSPAGLPLDKDYSANLDALRDRGSKLAECGSLAVVQRCEGKGVSQLLAMTGFNWSVTKLRATDMVIGVNPKAINYFRALYGFRPFARIQQHANLHAPVVGLHVAFSDVVRHAKRHLAKPCADGIPLAEYLCGKLPSCVQIPEDIPPHEMARWKLSRPVFQELFLHKSDRLANLDKETRAYLAQWRSQETLGYAEHIEVQPPMRRREIAA